MDEKLVMEAMNLQRQSEEAEQQLRFVEEQISEMEKFEAGLQEFEESNEKEMLALLGKGVYVKSDVKEKELFVEVGAGVVVKKSAEDVRKTIGGQIKKFNQARMQLTERLEIYTIELGRMVKEIEEKKKELMS